MNTNETNAAKTNEITLTVTRRDRGPGPGTHTTIVESPWAEALAVIDGLATASDNATYRGVRFGRKLQGELVTYLRTDYASPQWAAIQETTEPGHTPSRRNISIRFWPPPRRSRRSSPKPSPPHRIMSAPTIGTDAGIA